MERPPHQPNFDDPFAEISEDTQAARLPDEFTDANRDPVGQRVAGHVQVTPMPKGLEPWLEITDGPGRGACFNVRKPLVILGRISDVADVVLGDSQVSRHHAAIGYHNGVFTVYDLSSTNGTQVDGQPCHQQMLRHGSEIRVGETALTFWLE